MEYKKTQKYIFTQEGIEFFTIEMTPSIFNIALMCNVSDPILRRPLNGGWITEKSLGKIIKRHKAFEEGKHYIKLTNQ